MTGRHEVDSGKFGNLYGYLAYLLLHGGRVVDVGEWQSKRGQGTPQERTIEVRNVVFDYHISTTVRGLQQDVQPNLPWAEDHFLERVSGKPLNPGEQYKNWPWYFGNVEEHKTPGKFSHTYMERYWPKKAGYDHHNEEATGLERIQQYQPNHEGIRYAYGDLGDVVSLLREHPHTRQAVLPVWFPEDTGAVHGGRVPCSISYHFLLREGRLHCTYHIRSCDFFRHFQDDVYLTCRLVQWVLEQCTRGKVDEWKTDWAAVRPGTLTMMIDSLHVFEAERPRLEKLV